MGDQPWARLADALLQRDALLMRACMGLQPKDTAGVYVDIEDVDRILATLPGLNGPSWQSVEELCTLTDEILTEARAAFHEDIAAESRSVVGRICNALELDDASAECLALLLAVEVHTDRQRLVSYLQDDVTRPRITLGLLHRLLSDKHGDVGCVAPGSLLRILRLVEAEEGGSWSSRMVWPASPLVWASTASPTPHRLLPPGLRFATRPRSSHRESHSLVLVSGGAPTDRIAVAFEATAVDGFVVADLDLPSIESALAGAAVLQAGVLLEVADSLPTSVRSLIEATASVTWVVASRVPLPLTQVPRRPWVDRSIEQHLAPRSTTQSLGDLPLSPEQAALVEAAAPAFDGDGLAAVRRLVSGELERVATRIRPVRRRSDLVLGAEPARAVDGLVSRVKHRLKVHQDWAVSSKDSIGILALFAGPSGTGKTLAAEVVAGEMGLDMYKVNLSKIVSKYIGETEKNLDGVFSQAASGQVVLFFDEADALFGKRSDVSSAHDRYANQEVAYLLQAVEAYDGVVILATNLRRNIDQAFLRRLDVVVEFPEPDEEERARIWRLALPRQLPQRDVDIDLLASAFELTGGSIKNAAESAAFSAAASGVLVTTSSLVDAVEREYTKLGRLIDSDGTTHESQAFRDRAQSDAEVVSVVG